MSRWWFVLIVALGAGVAHAQPAPDPAAAAYLEARRLYDIKEWDQAIAKFKESYRLKPEARSLFNIAQAYRLKGDCVEAVSFYRTFKRNYPTEQTEKVDKFIVELEPCAKQQSAAATRPTVTPVPVTEPPKPEPITPVTTPPKPDPGVAVTPKPEITPEVKPRGLVPPAVTPAITPAPGPEPARDPEPIVETSSPGRGKRVAGLVIGGIGIAAVATGVYFGLRAKSTASDVEGGATWDPDLDRQGKAAERNAIILWGAGGAAIIGGGVLYFLGRRSAEPSRLSIVPRASGAAVVWACEL